jgi:hypothetical protein
MTPIRLLVSVVWVLGVVAGHEMWTARVGAVHHAPTTAVSLSLSTEAGDTADHYVDHYAEPRLDLYGNEIDEAVGDYRVDPAGDLYERHSPDTAVLTLGPAGA